MQGSKQNEVVIMGRISSLNFFSGGYNMFTETARPTNIYSHPYRETLTGDDEMGTRNKELHCMKCFRRLSTSTNL